MKTGDELFNQAWSKNREPRSGAYKMGMRRGIAIVLNEDCITSCPFAVGTAERDAFWAGWREGSDLAIKEKEEHQP